MIIGSQRDLDDLERLGVLGGGRWISFASIEGTLNAIRNRRRFCATSNRPRSSLGAKTL